MTCIFCKKEYQDLSVEHIIPDSIGGKLTYKCVCSSCNSKLGSEIDSLLCKEDIVLLLRKRFDIKSKAGESVDLTKEFPFFDKDNQRIIVGRGDGKTMPYRYNKSQKPEVVMNEKGIVSFKGGDPKAIQTAIIRQARKAGHRLDPNKVLNLVGSAKVEFIPEMARAEIRVDIHNFIPCILKIAYEYAYIQLGERYLDDPQAVDIRNYLWCLMSKSNKCTASLEVHYRAFNLPYIISVAQNVHKITLQQDESRLLVTIELFHALAFYVVVSNNAAAYNLPEQSIYACRI